MMEQQSLLTELEFNPVLASTGKRFLNCLIDFIVFYISFSLFLAVLLISAHLTVVPDNSAASELLLEALIIVFFSAYYSFCEHIFNGRTVGKFITGTKAVNEDGTKMNFRTVLLRSLSRIVPFEPFSAFGGHPWHDKWTKTYVIDVKKTGPGDLLVEP